ncbi:MAG: hypothetical protein IKG08_03345 [Eubacterium sp.]|nr:hypothetical protein [Eubacterium sp.]
MKKKIFAAALACVMTFSLAACGTKQEEVKEEVSAASEAVSEAVSEASAVSEAVSEASSAVEEISSAAEGLLGSWTLTTEAGAPMPDEVAEAFDKADKAHLGMNFEPVAYLGSQVVSGTNYMILCRGTTVTAQPVTGLKMVTVYVNTSGEAEILSVTDLDIAALAERDDAEGTPAGLTGGWTPAEMPVANLPAEAANAFTKAMEGFTGAGYDPTAVLATQLVSGTNYAILANQTVLTSDGEHNVCIVYIYEDLEGNCTITNIVPLNLGEYVEY